MTSLQDTRVLLANPLTKTAREIRDQITSASDLHNETFLTAVYNSAKMLSQVTSYLGSPPLETVSAGVLEIIRGLRDRKIVREIAVEKMLGGIIVYCAGVDALSQGREGLDITKYWSLFSWTQPDDLPQLNRPVIRVFHLPPDSSPLVKTDDLSSLCERKHTEFIDALIIWLESGLSKEKSDLLSQLLVSVKLVVPDERVATYFWMGEAILDVVGSENYPSNTTRKILPLVHVITEVLEDLAAGLTDEASQRITDRMIDFVFAFLFKYRACSEKADAILAYHNVKSSHEKLGPDYPQEFQDSFDPLLENTDTVIEQMRVLVTQIGALLKQVAMTTSDQSFAIQHRRLKNGAVRLFSVASVIEGLHKDLLYSATQIYQTVFEVESLKSLKTAENTIAIQLVEFEHRLLSLLFGRSLGPVVLEEYAAEGARSLVVESKEELFKGILLFNDFFQSKDRGVLWPTGVHVHKTANYLSFLKNDDIVVILQRTSRALINGFDKDILDERDFRCIAKVFAVIEFALERLSHGQPFEPNTFSALLDETERFETLPIFDLGWSNIDGVLDPSELRLSELKSIAKELNSFATAPRRGCHEPIHQCLHRAVPLCGEPSQTAIASLLKGLISLVESSAYELEFYDLDSTAHQLLFDGCIKISDLILTPGGGEAGNAANEILGRIYVWLHGPTVEVNLVTQEVVDCARDAFEESYSELGFLLVQSHHSQKDLDNLRLTFHRLHGNAISCGLESLAEVYRMIESQLEVVLAKKQSLNKPVVCPLLLKLIREVQVFMRAYSGQGDMPEAPKYLSKLSSMLWSSSTNSLDETIEVFADLYKYVPEDIREAQNTIRAVIDSEKYNSVGYGTLREAFHKIQGVARASDILGVRELFGLAEFEMAQIVEDGAELNTQQVTPFINKLLEETVSFIGLLDGPASMLTARAFVAELSDIRWALPVSNVTEAPLELRPHDNIKISIKTPPEKSAHLEQYGDEGHPQYDIESAVFFLEEYEELRPSLDRLLERMWKNQASAEDVREIYRFVHTLKGAAGIAEAHAVKSIYHGMEDVFEKISSGILVIDQNVRDFAALCKSEIAAGIQKLRSDEAFLVNDVLRSALSTLNTKRVLPSIQSLQSAYLESRSHEPGPDEPLENTEEIVRPISATKNIEKNDIQSFLDRKIRGRKNRRLSSVEQKTRTEITTQSLDRITDTASESLAGVNWLRTQTSRQSSGIKRCNAVAKQVHSIQREIEALISGSVETQFPVEHANKLKGFASRSNELLTSLSYELESLSQHSTAASRIVEGCRAANVSLHDEIRTSRLITFGSIFSPIVNHIENLANKEGKLISWDNIGLNEAFDRSFESAIKVAVQHILTNAITHGIEKPKKRHDSGKQQIGLIRIVVSQSRKRLQIVIQDDGAGINRKAVLAKAKANGLIGADETLSDQEILGLVTARGFSTKDGVNEDSGRGVGMDEVLTRVEKANGSLKIESTEKVLTRFTLTFNTSIGTRSVIRCASGPHVYAIPHSEVEKLFRGTAQIRDNVPFVSDPEGIEYQGIDLGELVAGTASYATANERYYVVLRSDTRRIALGIDRFEDMTDVVVFNPPPLLESVTLVNGYVEDENRLLSLVIDPQTMLRKDFVITEEGVYHRKDKPIPLIGDQKRYSAILFDGDHSVRRTTETVLTKLGFASTHLQTNRGVLKLINDRFVDVMIFLGTRDSRNEHVFVKSLLASKAFLGVPIIVVGGDESIKNIVELHGAEFIQLTDSLDSDLKAYLQKIGHNDAETLAS